MSAAEAPANVAKPEEDSPATQETAERRRFRIRLPATSANLGPGFDAAGLALSLALTVEAEPADRVEIEATGRHADVTGTVSNNLLWMTYEEVLAAQNLAAPALRLSLHNEIPLGMGCGSSAAALCAGVLLADHFGGLRWTDEQVLDEAARREGHPDNVAACLLGGLTVSRSVVAEEGRTTRTVAATLGHELPWRLLLALPRAALPTHAARALLPATYSRADAVLNVQATALLVSAFALNRPELLRSATEDRLHQPYRMGVCPLLARLLPLAGRGGVYSVTLSGAGPAVLLIVGADAAGREVDLEEVRRVAGEELSEVLELGIGAGAFASLSDAP